MMALVARRGLEERARSMLWSISATVGDPSAR